MSSKIMVDADVQPPLAPNLKSAINNSLLAHNAIPKIQAALLHQCQASGFTATLRQRTLELLRAGECNNYGEVMDKIIAELKLGSPDDSIAVNGKNGTDAGLKIPAEVIKNGIEIVRDAIEPVIQVGDKQD
ncbi:MAG: hypothetical protein GOMPHAMPRED_005807 [Gomphillus americanus]|uniref:Uncharacterized protein n=1 Tax=Gomphillus americanus TaxID=1940652 RepID=A0A8H3G0Q2_9LECA|nr:MAG: hypothetical protein GOMPHAMPRED_005807 [Gomphillus americanus]